MKILEETIESIHEKFPEVKTFFDNNGISLNKGAKSLGEFLDQLSPECYEDIGIDKANLIENLEGYLSRLTNRDKKNNFDISSITITGGKDKNGSPENIEITLQKGSITSIVGPTGSGKSRLLADIEWMARKDTPTGRTILIDGKQPDTELRFSLEHKLVAQLSQNMNFVIDAAVEEFISMHAESRFVKNPGTVIKEIIRQANLLAGEPFEGATPVTSLSGGQSRALMIADTAFLSASPVVLIDEIENAGIDRKKALGLLAKKEKIVLIATHDPILGLMAEQRFIIKNGGIHKVLKTTQAEKDNLEILQSYDNKITELRNRLRNGERLEDGI
ncbi:MAG: ATP-binding cassette domain-containing protein [Ignavibacteria bacterium]|jgi:ABC-type lipoprotein export system ATPase subunit